MVLGEIHNRPCFAVTSLVLPNKEYPKDNAKYQSGTEADDHGQEARRVAWRFVFEEELWSDDVAQTVRDEYLVSLVSLNPDNCLVMITPEHTIAFAVFFLVKPPTLLLEILRTSGKFAEYAMQKQYPTKRAQMFVASSSRTMIEPVSEMARLNAMKYVRAFFK